jgi:hypothetical protein
MTVNENRHDCPGCNRKFLSHAALSRHFERNPGHGDVVIDVRDVEPTGSGPVLVGSEWVRLGETIETFRVLPDGVTADDIDVRYDPEGSAVTVTGAYEDRIDAEEVADVVDGDLSWTVQGLFLLLSFPKREE